MDDAVTKLASDSGVLARVHGRRADVGYQELALAFERGTLRLTCDADSAGTSVSELRDVDEQALASLLGKVIEQAWEMTNDRGFDDGFQLRCIDLDTRAEACVQVEAAAGVLRISQVTPLRRHS